MAALERPKPHRIPTPLEKKMWEYIEHLEAEKERLARVAEDRIAALDRCTERAVYLERKLDTLTANPSTETLKDPCHQCGSTNIWHGYDATNQIEYDVCNDCGRRVNALPGEPKASEDTDPDGRANGEVLDEPQTITEKDAAAGLEKMFEEPTQPKPRPEDYPNRWGLEFEGSPCGSCGHNTSGDAMDSDTCAEVGCDGDYSEWIPPPEEPREGK